MTEEEKDRKALEALVRALKSLEDTAQEAINDIDKVLASK